MHVGWLLAFVAGCHVDVHVGGDDTDACDARTGGAFVAFDVNGESFTTWSTSADFVDVAEQHLADGTTQVPVFAQVVEGEDCADPQWSWHVDPARQTWADFTTEVCDGQPSYIEANLQDWIDQIGQWCPWSAVVTDVDDRR